MLWCPLRFPYKTDVRFVFTSICFRMDHECLIYVICACLSIVVSNAYYGFVLFVFGLCLVYPMLPVSLDCSFLIAPMIFSNVELSNSILKNALSVLTINKMSFSFVDTVLDNTLNCLFLKFSIVCHLKWHINSTIVWFVKKNNTKIKCDSSASKGIEKHF